MMRVLSYSFWHLLGVTRAACGQLFFPVCFAVCLGPKTNKSLPSPALITVTAHGRFSSLTLGSADIRYLRRVPTQCVDASDPGRSQVSFLPSTDYYKQTSATFTQPAIRQIDRSLIFPPYK